MLKNSKRPVSSLFRSPAVELFLHEHPRPAASRSSGSAESGRAPITQGNDGALLHELVLRHSRHPRAVAEERQDPLPGERPVTTALAAGRSRHGGEWKEEREGRRLARRGGTATGASPIALRRIGPSPAVRRDRPKRTRRDDRGGAGRAIRGGFRRARRAISLASTGATRQPPSVTRPRVFQIEILSLTRAPPAPPFIARVSTTPARRR